MSLTEKDGFLPSDSENEILHSSNYEASKSEVKHISESLEKKELVSGFDNKIAFIT